MPTTRMEINSLEPSLHMSYYNAPRTRSHPVLDSSLMMMRRSNGVSLEVRQQPRQALVTSEHKEKTRKAIDPPPIVQLKVLDSHSADQSYWLVNPFLFMNVQLVDSEPVNGIYKQVPGSSLLGTTVSSLHRLKDITNRDGGFFVFGDISCRRLGIYRLQFNLFDFEKNHHHAVYIASTVSNPFHVVTTKDFRGQMESTPLSRTFSDQGVRLRLRKEQRTVSGTKRSYGSPTRESSTPAMPFHGSGNSMHDRPYGYNAPKRQRSDGEYIPQMYHTPQLSSNPLLSYGSPFPTGGHALSVHPQQNVLTSQAETYDGMMSQSHTPSTPNPNWQRHGQQEPYSAPVGGSGNNSYYNLLNTMIPGSRSQTFTGHTQQQNQQYSIRTAEYPSTSLGGYQVPTSLSDSTLGSHELQSYTRSGANLQSHPTGFSIGQTSYAIQNHGSPEGTQGHFGLRMGQTNPGMYGYETRMRPDESDASHDQQLQIHTTGQYDQTHFAGGEVHPPETSRDSLSSHAANLSDTSPLLDSGVLNRGFMPPYPSHQQDSPELPTPAYKEPPDFFTSQGHRGLHDSRQRDP